MLEIARRLLERKRHLETPDLHLRRAKPAVVDEDVSIRMFPIAQFGFDLVFEIVVEASLQTHARAPELDFVLAELRIEVAIIRVQAEAERGAEFADSDRRRRKVHADVGTDLCLIRRLSGWLLGVNSARQQHQDEKCNDTPHQSPFFGTSHDTDLTPAVPPAISCALRSSRDRLGSTDAW